MTFLYVPTLILLLLLPWATAPAPTPGSTVRNEISVGLPEIGVISISSGTVTFVKGQLIVRLEYHIRGFLVRSAVNLYDRAVQLLLTLTKVSLTSAHQAAVMDTIHSMSYYFRMLISRTGEQVLRRLNYVSIRKMEQDWRRKLSSTKEHMERKTRTTGTETRVIGPTTNDTNSISTNSEDERPRAAQAATPGRRRSQSPGPHHQRKATSSHQNRPCVSPSPPGSSLAPNGSGELPDDKSVLLGDGSFISAISDEYECMEISRSGGNTTSDHDTSSEFNKTV